MDKNNIGDSLEDLNIKVLAGSLLFDIVLDVGFKGEYREQAAEKHNHSFFEVHFVTGGDGILKIGDVETILLPGHYYIVAPGVYHSIYSNKKNPVMKYYFKFSYSVPKTSDFLLLPDERLKIATALLKMQFSDFVDVKNNVAIINDIHKEFLERQICFYSEIQVYFSMIMINIIRDILPHSGRQNVLPRKIKDDNRSSIIEQYFDNYCSSISPGDLAALLNISKRQLTRVMKELYNATFKQKLLDTRIEVAKDLLKNSSYPVDVISEKVGYISPRNFQQIFRKKTGLSPSEYKKRSKKLYYADSSTQSR